MRTGTVTGALWATRRVDGIPAGAFLSVSLDGGEQLVAFDVLGTGVGERVLVCQGSSVGRRLPATAPIDALIIGSVDMSEQVGPAGSPSPAAVNTPTPAPIRPITSNRRA